MNLSIVEILLITLQVLLLPFAKYLFSLEKEKIENKLIQIITEYYSSLENLIDNNKNKITNINETLKHKAEMYKIKQAIVNARIKDIEVYLQKQNGFHTKQLYDDNDSSFL